MGKTSKKGEVMMACSRGLYFANVQEIGQLKMTVNQGEVYFKEQDVKSAIEFRRDHIVTCFDMDYSVHIIDRKQRSVIKRIENPSN
jgi:hypothetical protein